jgi:hypothetical protein
MPMTAEECFEGHARPEDTAPWTVWVCPQDHELVYPEDVNALDMLEANKDHPLLTHLVRNVPGDEPDSIGIDPGELMSYIIARPSKQPDLVIPIERPQDPADPNDTLITIVTPILSGFSLAAIVTIATAGTVGPGAYPAMACFGGSAVLMLFSIQILAIGRLPGLRKARWPSWVKPLLYELGLLAFLVGLGLIMWLKTWPAAAVAGVVVVGLAVISDLTLVAIAWCRHWDRPQLSLGTRTAAPDAFNSARCVTALRSAWVPGRRRRTPAAVMLGFVNQEHL